MICKNCEQQFQGSFCNNCGQKSNVKRINFAYLLHFILIVILITIATFILFY